MSAPLTDLHGNRMDEVVDLWQAARKLESEADDDSAEQNAYMEMANNYADEFMIETIGYDDAPEDLMQRIKDDYQSTYGKEFPHGTK